MSNPNRQFNFWNPVLLLFLIVSFGSGCGKTIRQAGTEQLLASDAVDQAVAGIDFSAMAGEKVYFDTQFIRQVKTVGFVNSNYIISSMRQQLFAARCELQDDREKADYIVEARIGTLGTDQNELSYGLPASNLLSTASTLVSTIPALPTIPELSIAKRIQQSAAAKIAVFAYHRETKEPVWQSGTKQVSSKSRELWVLGAGPFQRGSIYKGTQLAGSSNFIPFLNPENNPEKNTKIPNIAYNNEHIFIPNNEDKPDQPGLSQAKSKVEFATQTKTKAKSPPEKSSVKKPVSAPPVTVPVKPSGPVYRLTDPNNLPTGSSF